MRGKRERGGGRKRGKGNEGRGGREGRKDGWDHRVERRYQNKYEFRTTNGFGGGRLARRKKQKREKKRREAKRKTKKKRRKRKGRERWRWMDGEGREKESQKGNTFFSLRENNTRGSSAHQRRSRKALFFSQCEAIWLRQK